ncbi:KTSC domain-containing protein [Shewanella sp. phage 1/41]|uniref:KTSC domain-containing protein n=1 Tax=Shewanella sp. phage 1/41 TaxID=1458861 RepID=UPI0004F913D4|nr:KTSC domain-containing protein [Shewanella sp. phage 1/41]AHK11674.1 KTSC domain-containing protein [Shewanella sp. phage 1/41]
MKMTPVTSSNIASIGYDLVCTELVVQFKNGKTFYYLEVSPEEHAALMAAESAGKHFNQFIKAVKVGHEVVIAITDDINTDDELAAENKSIFKSVADENFKSMKSAIQQCGVKDKVIAEQAEDIKLLREALQDVLWKSSTSRNDAIHIIVTEALEATKDGE